jgi:hypothetical protein
LFIYKIYDALKVDEGILTKVGNRIKFYEYPATGDITGPVIVIDPLDTPIPSDFADNKWLTEDYFYQIEVWSKSLADTESIAKQIQSVMWKEFGFAQKGGVNEWDKDTGIYRDARRYRGKVYVE